VSASEVQLKEEQRLQQRQASRQLWWQKAERLLQAERDERQALSEWPLP
jgi:hypothetical protein